VRPCRRFCASILAFLVAGAGAFASSEYVEPVSLARLIVDGKDYESRLIMTRGFARLMRFLETSTDSPLSASRFGVQPRERSGRPGAD
jgi:hypothetical protein